MVQGRYLNLNKFFLFFILLCVILVTRIVNASPYNGVVASGDAVINNYDKQVHITQHSDRAIIDWDSFNIAVNEQTKFIQPDSNSIALNRIHSNTMSEIHGKLTANGKVILINQNGFLFGKTAKADLNGLLATTADINNENFMQQNLNLNNDNFTNDLLLFDLPGSKDAKIINNGKITVKQGLLGLVAPAVINKGTITAGTGKVQLGSGETFTLDLYGDELINIAVSGSLKDQLIFNSGRVIANGNKISLTAAAGEHLINSLIVSSGALKSRSVSHKNGEIVIMAHGSNAVIDNDSTLKGIKSGQSQIIVSGLVDVSGVQYGGSGGKIKILGDNIKLQGNSIIDASGYSGKYHTTIGLEKSAKRIGSAGGEILIGGDYLGKGKIPTAIELTVASMAQIYNDSYEIGDAGRTILWSDGITNFNGKVYSRALGGVMKNNYGDGGFLEISGSKKLIANGTVDLFSAVGETGTYVLDPNSITVHNNSVDLSSYNIDPTLSYDPITTGDSHINSNYIANLNANVVLIADTINLDLAQDSINLLNDHSITIRSRTSFNVLSKGSITTYRNNTGGNISIINEGGNIDLSNFDLIANNYGEVNLTSFNGTIKLGTTTAGIFNVKALGPHGVIYHYAPTKSITVTDANWAADLYTELFADATFSYTTNSFHSLNINTNELKTQTTVTPIPIAVDGGNIVINASKANLYSLDLNANTGNVTINAVGDVVMGGITANSLTVNVAQDLSGYYGSGNLSILEKKLAVHNLALDVDGNIQLNLPANDLSIANYNSVTVYAKGAITNGTLDSNIITTGNLVFRGKNINFAGMNLNAGANNITITSTEGNTTLGNLTAANILVQALGYDSKIIIPIGTKLIASGTNSPLILVAEGNINNQNPNHPENYPLQLTDNTARWLIYSSNHKNDVGVGTDFLGEYNLLYKSTYHAGTLPVNAGNLINYASSDPIQIPILAANYSDKNANIDKSVTVKNLSLVGVNANNYNLTVSQASGNIGQIDPADVSIALTGKVKKTYDGTIVATDLLVYNPHDPLVNNYSVTGFVAADVAANTVSVDLETAIYNDKNVAVEKPLTVSGLNLTGVDATNYNLTTMEITGNVGEIVPSNVSVVLSGTVRKIYDGTSVAANIIYNPQDSTVNNYTVTGFVAADVAANTIALDNYSNGNYYNQDVTAYDKNVGSNKLVEVTTLALTGSEVNNYNLLSSRATGNVGFITPKALRVRLTDNDAHNPVDKIYDGSNTAVVRSINYILDGLVTVNNSTDNVLLNNNFGN